MLDDYLGMVVLCCSYLCFFFFEQKTAYELRISDWSSDVCSSDLGETLTVVPFAGSNGGVPVRRDFIELSVLPSYQGLALEPRSDNLEIRRFPRGVEIGTPNGMRSEEHTYELQSLMRISYAVFCLKKKNQNIQQHRNWK